MKHFKLMKGVLACLLSLVLVATSITPTNEISATETATTTTTVVAPVAKSAAYYPMGDYIKSTDGGKIVYVLKNEKGNTIKKGSKCFELSTTDTDNTLTAIGVKSTAKDAYLYVCDKEFEEDGKNINANLVIKGQAAKKITAVIDYTQADDKDSVSVLSIKAVDKNKKNLENPVCIWSEDGTTWKEANQFKGSDLLKILENGGGTLQVKMLGTDAAPYTRTSKAIKVKIAKQGKAPTVKVDVKKDTFSIKNGMDFGLFTKSGDKYVLVENTTWHTVLPQLKTAATKTLEASIVSTKSYTPLNKKDTNATKAITDNKVAYTSVKVKAVGFDVLTENLNSGSGVNIFDPTKEYYVGVRTSATEKKPASAVTYFKFSDKTEAPIVYTQSNVDGQYLVASGTDFAKKGIVLGTVANYNGANGTKGYDDSFELLANQKDADTTAAAYEFAIVNKADFMSGSGNTIDMSSIGWKKLDPAKTKFSAKTKTKYNTLTKTGITATLSAGSLSGEVTSGDIPEDVKTIILVRRAGVKGKTADEATLASCEIALYVLKNGKNYEIYSTECNGDEAAKYTVNFYKYSLSGEATSGEYTWVKDDSLTVTGWGGGDKATTEYATFPTVENADFFELNAACTSVSGSKLEAATGSNAGKYAIAVNAGTDEVVKNIAIREYANVKVVAVASDSGETVGTATEVGTVKAGKVGKATTVTAYVGDQFTVSTSGETTVIPTGYTSESGASVALSSNSGEGFTGAGYSSGSGVTITVNTAKEVTVTLKNPVVKIYTITYDLNTPSDVTLGSGVTAPTTNNKTNGEKKLAALATFSSLKGTKGSGDTVETWHVTGWYKEAACTNAASASDIYSADTTLYAKWEKVTT